MLNALRTRHVVPALALAAFGAAALATSPANAPATQEGEAAAQEEEEHSPLHESMEEINSRLRTLRKLLKDPEKKGEAIELCREMEHYVLVGFEQIPKPAEALEGAALLEYEVDFRKRMLVVAQTLLDLELAFGKEDLDAAKTLYRQLGAQKKDGHNVYIK